MIKHYGKQGHFNNAPKNKFVDRQRTWADDLATHVINTLFGGVVIAAAILLTRLFS